ncbi:MAG TPA: ATP-binding protein [Candidatus Saccharimonadales bacterium]
MLGLLIFIGIVVVVLAIAGPIVFMQLQRSRREQKNYERGLKMVPLMIHLPPPSEDTEVGGRDTRDVIDETISKAQIIYNIVSSTAQKGFKARLNGQRHFAFEIVGTQGFVYFYAAVPVAMVDVVKQAVVSAYPSARLEEVSEHNIFNPIGKITGTVGGELKLKEPYAYPIATYQDLKRDALQSVLDSLSTLEKEDGAGIQILLRPADPSWRKVASALASKKRKGDDKKFGIGSLAKEVALAAVRVPENKAEGGSKKELSNLEQATLDAIDDKTRHAGYEVQIRLIASSNISQRAQSILNNIVASFSLFDAPGKNGFKYTPAKETEEFVTDYIMRFFKGSKKPMILNSVELATLFHFPEQRNVSTSQVSRQESKQVDGPRNVPDNGLLLGYNVFRGVKKPIRLDLADRQRHMYVVGQTGVGKSVFLENLAFQDMLNGDGFAFVDPHGDTAEKLLSMVPRERTEDVIYFSPADMDFPMGLNLFEFHSPDQKDFLIQEALNMLYKLYDPQHQGIMGPRYEHLFRNAALTVMADPAGGTFVDIPKLFRDPKFVEQKLQYVKDQNVLEFWRKEMPQSQRSNEFGEVVSWFVSKFGAFLSNEMMRNIIGQTHSAFDLRDIMDHKKILLVNLSKGRLGDLNSKLLGMIFVMKFQAAAMSRANVPENERVDFSLYVDEFQNFSTDSFATIMSEARKYHLNLIVANQFTTQLTPEIRDAVFGNMGTIVSFRIGQNDVEAITKYFQPTFDADDLLRVPNYNTIIRTLIGGVPTQPFSMATLPPLGNPNPKLAGALKQLSAAKHGRPRAEVEKEIFERMATKPDPVRPTFGGGTAGAPGSSSAASPFAGAPRAGSPWQSPSPSSGGIPAAASSAGGAAAHPASGQPGPTGTGSFLDEWLSKRSANVTPAASPTSVAPVPDSLGSASTAPPVAPDAQHSPVVAPAPGPAPAPEEPMLPPQLGPSQSALGDQASAATPLPGSEVASQTATRTAADDILRAKMTDIAKSLDVHAEDKGANISSEELEKDEVTEIAEQLKKSMKNGESKDESGDASKPAAAGTLDDPDGQKAGELKLPERKAPIAELGEDEGDTIVIDQEGNLHQRDEAEPPEGGADTDKAGA